MPKFHFTSCKRYFRHHFVAIRPRLGATEGYQLEVFKAHDSGVSQSNSHWFTKSVALLWSVGISLTSMFASNSLKDIYQKCYFDKPICSKSCQNLGLKADIVSWADCQDVMFCKIEWIWGQAALTSLETLKLLHSCSASMRLERGDYSYVMCVATL